MKFPLELYLLSLSTNVLRKPVVIESGGQVGDVRHHGEQAVPTDDLVVIGEHHWSEGNLYFWEAGTGV